MAVKPLSGVSRALDVVEAVAAHQPVGVTELARLLGQDKSAVQRSLVTLHASKWIRPVDDPQGGRVGRWELSTRPLVIAAESRRRSGLLIHARPMLQELSEQTGETVILAVADDDRIVSVDVVESRRMVRTAPRPGMVFPPATSAAGIALFAAMPDGEAARYGVEPDEPSFAAELERTRRRGWSLNAGAVQAGATSIGAAVLDVDRRPIAALVLSAPSDRLGPDQYQRAGEQVAAAAATLGGTAVY
ncbi:IclR family transcriptional regulator [Actinomadura darangshiensis]|uniref:IclR family transcriptional regulator n=1 Tax=Actinomadura darangshiensis TaxID=705336 RepID=A0A4R5BFJ3_9ACTN|nr:IclR family transcriptional regulator [Actinomadura darangshiensis]TDD84405.1 IclR family transcriptional regulator [Actinomadura darangshiensis]